MSNIKIQSYVYGYVGTNCYIISNNTTKEAVVIDPADNAIDIKNKLEKNKLILKAILITHGHFDHIDAASELKSFYEGVNIYLGELDKDVASNPDSNCTKTFGIVNQKSYKADIFVKDGEILDIAGMKFKVIHTPGHTKGGVCYYILDEKVLISGDTLFCCSVGRTDLSTGSFSDIVKSIREKLFLLDDDTRVLPGHGDETTIGYEKKYNPYAS